MKYNHIAIIHPGMHFVGGAERLMTDLALGLADKETHVEFVTGVCHDFWRSQLTQKENVTVKELGKPVSGNLKFWLNVGQYAKALAELVNPETEVVIASNFPSNLVAQLFSKQHKAKIVNFIHDPIAILDKEGVAVLSLKLRTFYRFMSMLYANREIKAVQAGDLILSPSILSRRANAKVYHIDESRIHVVYPGVNLTHIAPSRDVPSIIREQVEHGIPIIFVPKGAQFWRRPEICLQALARLRNDRYVALFTGGADYEASSLLSNARELGIADKVVWMKELQHDEINAAYTYSTLVVSIAKRQGFGLIPLEALVCGAPSIISYSSGVSEVLQDGVETLIVHDDNPEELTKAIDTLISDEATRQKIISNGQRKVLEQFTTSRFVNEIKEKLQKLA